MSGAPSQNQFQHPSFSTQNQIPASYNRQISQPLPPNNHQFMHTQPQAIQSNQPTNQPQQQPKAEQIYAPVAHLQQKMMHQQQGNLQQIQAQVTFICYKQICLLGAE